MRAAIAVMLMALVLGACKQDDDVTGTSQFCPARVYAYDAKDLKQCVAACIACDRGVTTTCTTSCTLKGAR